MFTHLHVMRYIYLVLFLWCLSFVTKAQSFQYVNGSLDITWNAFNPCGTPAPDNGYLELTINAASGGFATLIFLDGPGTLDIAGEVIAVGSTYTFNVSQTLPNGNYNYIVRDQAGTTINSFASPISFPPVTLTDLASVTLTEDVLTNNTVCSNPTTGQIQSSINGGSKALSGGGSFDYTWTSTNGLTGLPLSGTTDGTTPLDLATLLGVPGLPGGTYSLSVTDNYASCSTSRSFTITDPSPAIQIITTPTPYNNCIGEDITITLNNSESAVTYTILRNGVATSNTFIGTGAGPFVMTFPSTGFSDNDVIQVRATNGFCSPSTMSGSVLLNVNSLPTASISGTTVICSGGSATLTFTLPSSGTFNVVYTDGTTTFNANGIVNGATVSVNPTANTTYTIVSVTNTTTNCTSTAPSANITGSAVITVNPLPTASISGTATICTGGTAQLTFTLPAGTYNIVYTDGTTNFIANGVANGAQVNVTPSANTTYTIVSVTSTTTSCTVSAPSPNITGSAVITVNPLPTAQITGTTTICSGSSATLTFTLSAGTYDVVYTDGTTNFTASGSCTMCR